MNWPFGRFRWLPHITRFGDSPNRFKPFDWEPDPRGELR